MYQTRIIMFVVIFFSVLSLFAQKVVWDDFYAMSSQAEAEQTFLKSTDAFALQKAGLYYFSIAHGALGIKIQKKNRIENARKAVSYFEKAYKLDRKNPAVRTWLGTSNLALASISKKLTDRIRFSNRGISHFNAIYNEGKNNLNYLAMRTLSFTPVPKSFKNLTKQAKESAQLYLQIFQDKKDKLSPTQLQSATVMEPAMYVCIAYVDYILKKKSEARKWILKVDETFLLGGNSKDSAVVKNYNTLKKKL